MDLNIRLDIPDLHNRFNEYLPIEADDEFDNLLICHIVRFFVICIRRGKFLRRLDGSGMLGSIGILFFCKNQQIWTLGLLLFEFSCFDVIFLNLVLFLFDFVWRKVRLDCPMKGNQI